MPITEPRICPSAVCTQQGAAVVAAHHDQKAGDFGITELSPRREFLLFFPLPYVNYT